MAHEPGPSTDPSQLGTDTTQPTASRFAFLGDGLYPGDGGAELERLWRLLPWRPIRGCDGRFTSRDRALGALSLRQLCDLHGVAASSPVVSCRAAAEGVDAVEAVRLRGGGGLLSYCLLYTSPSPRDS